MKKFNIVLTIAVITMITYFSFAEKSPANLDEPTYEIMYVDFRMTGNFYGLAVMQKGKEAEFHKLSSMVSKGNVSDDGQVIINVFQKLYDQGWEIESSVGDAVIHRYILKRKK